VTVFESVSLADELTLTVVDDPTSADQVVCPGVAEPNLVSRALAALRDEGWDGPPVRIEIVKRIPVAAGMGGGSADAAAALRLADRVKPLPAGAALQIAAELGADIPSQLVPGLSLGTGAGEIIEPLAPLAPHAFVLVPQPVKLSTADVYAEANRLGLGRGSLDGLVERLRAGELKFVNDLQPAAVALCPAIADALAALREAGAEHMLVCGSGATVAGLYWGEDASEQTQAVAARIAGAVTAVPVVQL
jgi:4-diphosphocytidyl-2-C-methyl-D-erythritol kinase